MAHYHFIGIGGVGMGKLASLLLSRGDRVSGSDLIENNMVRSLKDQGALITLGHDAGHLCSPDCVVYSSAVRENNPELSAARTAGSCRVMHRAQLLAELMKDFYAVTVAGAHGKTTTTSLIAHILTHAGLDPTAALGGIFQQGSYKEMLGKSRYFVAELDESDGSFLRFSPHVSVITNIDFEHVDYYGTWEKILDSYRTFISQTRKQGIVIACGEDKNLCRLLEETGRPFLSYGFHERNHLCAEQIVFDQGRTAFQCRYNDECLGGISLTLLGKHNILNALAAAAAGLYIGLPFSDIAGALNSYHGVHRRFECKGRWQDVILYDDYAHHPTEIRSTLDAACLLKSKRVIAVFQPHRYSRTKFLQQEFKNAFHGADIVLVTDVYAAGEESAGTVDARDLCQGIAEQSGCDTRYCAKEQIVERILDVIRDGDLVITLGAGDIVKISDEIAQCLNERFTAGHA